MTSGFKLLKRFLAACFVAVAAASWAQPLTLVVPHPPGGADVYARYVAKYLSAQLNREVVVVNNPAAGGRVAVDQVAKSTSGNEFLLASTGPFLFNKVVYKHLNSDFENFEAVTPLVRIPVVFSVSLASGANSIRDIKALSNQRTVNCSGSSASSLFLGRYHFNQLGINNVTWVPFKGSADMNTQLAAGNIDCAFDTVSPALTLHEAGKYKTVATAGATKIKSVPEAELIKDIVPGLTFYNWYGMGVKVNTPNNDRIQAALRKINQDPGYLAEMSKRGLEVVTPQQHGSQWIHSEYVKFELIRQQLNIDKLD